MADTRLVFLSLPGVGHLVSMVETAKRILRHAQPAANGARGLSATFLVLAPISTPAVATYVDTVAADGLDIEFEVLSPTEPPASACDMPSVIFHNVESGKPHVKSAISRLVSSSSVRVAGLVIDFMAAGVMDVVDEFDIPCFIYVTSCLSALAVLFRLPEIYEKITVDFWELEGEEVTVPGLPPVPAASMPSAVMKRNWCYSWVVGLARRICGAKGIIVNSFADLEPAPLEAIAEGRCAPHRLPPLYYVGPILMTGHQPTSGADGTKQRHECLSWLDRQPAGSVVLLCFGSAGSFSAPQVKQVATALERSGHRFLWVLRVASSGHDDGSCSDKALPEGFLDRTEGRGMVWPAWAPQAEMLAHAAVGGFVTHCGWNSALEGLWHGVPMLGWPLYAEQHLNAFAMAKVMGVALELGVDRKAGNFVSAEELEKGIRRLMENTEEEGKRVRAKAMEMKVASRKALMEEGGSSFACMQKLVTEFLA